MTPSPLMRVVRRVWYFPKPALLLLFMMAIPLASSFFPSFQLLSFLASYPVLFQPCLYLSVAFVVHLVFFYIASINSVRSYFDILSAFFPFLLVQYFFPFLLHVALPCLCSVSPLSKKGVVVILLASFILQARFTRLQLVATGLILISILSFNSLLALLPANCVGPLSGLSMVVFIYYSRSMPNFFLSFAPIIRRTMASFFLLFLLYTPQLLTFFGVAAAHVLIFLLTPQTRKANYVARRLHATGYVDYGEAVCFISWLSWSFCILFLICAVAKFGLHFPSHLKFL